jgi:hypothetical protein
MVKVSADYLTKSRAARRSGGQMNIDVICWTGARLRSIRDRRGVMEFPILPGIT